MDDYLGLVGLAKKLDIDLVIPGPDVPVIEGIEGYFRNGISPLSVYCISQILTI